MNSKYKEKLEALACAGSVHSKNSTQWAVNACKACVEAYEKILLEESPIFDDMPYLRWFKSKLDNGGPPTPIQAAQWQFEQDRLREAAIRIEMLRLKEENELLKKQREYWIEFYRPKTTPQIFKSVLSLEPK